MAFLAIIFWIGLMIFAGPIMGTIGMVALILVLAMIGAMAQ